MENRESERKCKVCDKLIRGRSDKIFCDMYCRAIHNNQAKGPANRFMRNINNALGKNRKILKDLLAGNGSPKKISRDKLLEAGFQFKYLTHTLTNQKRGVYYFCYEFGYRLLDNDCFLIVKKPEE
ncbi:hypothetical protein [Ferruginibacter sp. HRS2-29]|uniref:hypothetical protein n=1 Tax=Ferruginibacter sp. HRS2-29 TaxID=2487334 RepID=UPI0020CFE868|nr:hypothetical protein [Ferruginibacter sp. HRS2-29]MCP9749567.1 hypothetical protein [Ferruginibacter sp. HRS2-29]